MRAPHGWPVGSGLLSRLLCLLPRRRSSLSGVATGCTPALPCHHPFGCGALFLCLSSAVTGAVSCPSRSLALRCLRASSVLSSPPPPHILSFFFFVCGLPLTCSHCTPLGAHRPGQISSTATGGLASAASCFPAYSSAPHPTQPVMGKRAVADFVAVLGRFPPHPRSVCVRV